MTGTTSRLNVAHVQRPATTWPPMPSSPGNISRGSSSPTRTSPSRPDGYWTCMRPHVAD